MPSGKSNVQFIVIREDEAVKRDPDVHRDKSVGSAFVDSKKTKFFTYLIGKIPKRSNGADCKSVGSAFAGSNPALPTFFLRE